MYMGDPNSVLVLVSEPPKFSSAEQVLGLEIAVHDAERVGLGHALAGLQQVRAQRGYRHALWAVLQRVPEGLSL